MKLDEHILELCRKWDEFIGFNIQETVTIDDIKNDIITNLNNSIPIRKDLVDKWNRKIILAKEKKNYNEDLNIIYYAIKYGKTEYFYRKFHDKPDINISQFENLIKDCCEKIIH